MSRESKLVSELGGALDCVQTHGVAIVRGVLTPQKVEELIYEVSRVARIEGSVCVRHLRSKSPMIDALAFSDVVVNLIGGDYVPVRSILFDKNETMNWPVAWHQDLTIAVQEKSNVEGYGPWSEKDGAVHVHAPASLLEQMVTLRFHLDDATAENGALRVVPDSHRLGRLQASEVSEYLTGEVICECITGDVLLMMPLTLHASNKSVVPERRRVIHIEYAPKDALHQALIWHESPVRLSV